MTEEVGCGKMLQKITEVRDNLKAAQELIFNPNFNTLVGIIKEKASQQNMDEASRLHTQIHQLLNEKTEYACVLAVAGVMVQLIANDLEVITNSEPKAEQPSSIEVQ